MELQKADDQIRKLDAELWAVSVDPAGKPIELRKGLGLTFTNLMDPDSETIKRYGILDQEHGAIPHPTEIVLDKQGVVRFLRVDEDYRKRPTKQELLDVLRRLPQDTSRPSPPP